MILQCSAAAAVLPVSDSLRAGSAWSIKKLKCTALGGCPLLRRLRAAYGRASCKVDLLMSANQYALSVLGPKIGSMALTGFDSQR